MYSFSLATEIFLLGYICVFDENAFSHLIRHLFIPFTPIGQTDPGLSSGTEIGSNSV